MLRIPEPRPGARAFDPDADVPSHAALGPTNHSLSLRMTDGARDEAVKSGAILMGFRQRPDAGDAAIRPEDILDHAVVKDALTALHREGDGQLTALAARTGVEIGSIVKDQERFLRDQETRYNARFTDDGQRLLFRQMSREYFGQARERAGAIRDRRILEYREEATLRQNEEFVNQALRPENIFDDLLQTQYRDMLLFNLENLYADLPDADREARLDAACRDYYAAILERRLELDPGRMRVMLAAPSVRRVLGGELTDLYEKQADQAMRADEVRTAGKTWAEAGFDSREAKTEGGRRFPGGEERAAALAEYNECRRLANRRLCLGRMEETTLAWDAMREGGFSRNAIPAGVRRNHPALYDVLARMAEARLRNGGQPPDADYLRLDEFAAGFDPSTTLEKLRDETEIHSLLADLGGPDTSACQAVLRLIAGESTPGDRALFADLGLARSLAEAAAGESATDDELREFLGRFAILRRIRMMRNGVEELDETEVAELCGGLSLSDGERAGGEESARESAVV